jgi:hypothetical protein
MEEDEIERQLLIDTDSDYGTDESECGEEGRGSEPEVDEEPSSSSATWGPPNQHGRRSANNYSGGAVGLNTDEAPHVNKDSTPFCVFMLYFIGIIRLLVEETNKYYHQYLDDLDRLQVVHLASKVHRSTSFCVFSDISIRGGHSTSLADFL